MADTTQRVASGASSSLTSNTRERVIIAWVNDQLRKGSSVQIAKLLDLADGTALVSLIEVLCGEKVQVSDLEAAQTAEEQCKDGEKGEPNASEEQQLKTQRVEAALGVMRSKQIRMGTVSAAEIASGDQRAIMRVVLALATHFKPVTARMQPIAVSSPNSVSQTTKESNESTFKSVRRERTWQNFRDALQTVSKTAKRSDSDALSQRNDDEPLSKRGDLKFQRSQTFDFSTASRSSTDENSAAKAANSGDSTENSDLLFSFSNYAKMSDAEKLNNATRRGASKRQEWLEQRRKRLAPPASDSTAFKPERQAALAVAEHSTNVAHQKDVDETETPNRGELASAKGDAPAQPPDSTLRNVRDTRELLTKLQCTMLLNRVLDDPENSCSWNGESNSAMIDSVLADEFEADVEKALSASDDADADADTDADCVILRSRLDVALAKQRELAIRLQHARLVNSNLTRTNATLRERLSRSEQADSCKSSADCEPKLERIAKLETEMTRLRNELRARDRLIMELVANRNNSDSCLHCTDKLPDETKQTETALEVSTATTLNEEVDELSEMMSRSLSAYSPSHDSARRPSFVFDDFEPPSTISVTNTPRTRVAHATLFSNSVPTATNKTGFTNGARANEAETETKKTAVAQKRTSESNVRQSNAFCKEIKSTSATHNEDDEIL